MHDLPDFVVVRASALRPDTHQPFSFPHPQRHFPNPDACSNRLAHQETGADRHGNLGLTSRHSGHAQKRTLLQIRPVCDQMVTAQLVFRGGLAKASQIARACEQPHRPRSHTANHQLRGIRPDVAKSNIRLPATEAEQLGGDFQIHADIRPVPLQTLDSGQQQVNRDGIGACHAHQPAGIFILTLDLGAQVQSCTLHTLCRSQCHLASGREQVSILGAQKQLGSEFGLQRIQASPYRCLINAQAARCGAQ